MALTTRAERSGPHHMCSEVVIVAFVAWDGTLVPCGTVAPQHIDLMRRDGHDIMFVPLDDVCRQSNRCHHRPKHLSVAGSDWWRVHIEILLPGPSQVKLGGGIKGISNPVLHGWVELLVLWGLSRSWLG